MIEKTKFGNGIVSLKFINQLECLTKEFPTPTSVHCFPIKDDKILFTVNPRGIDIVGGHVEKNETPEETLFRESKEEVSIIPINYHLIGAIEINNAEHPEAIKKGYPLIGYQLFYLVNEFEILPFKETHECTDRIFLSKEDIISKHHNWLNIHQQILEEALNFLEVNNGRKFKTNGYP